jgi:hypothetical protein
MPTRPGPVWHHGKPAAAMIIAVAVLTGCAGSSDPASPQPLPVAIPGSPEPELAISPTPAGTADPALAVLGSWTLARSGDRVCTVELGSRNAAGEYTAKTRNCGSVELARIAFWKPLTGGLVLFDFERRPVVIFRTAGADLYEGEIAAVKVTLWR